MEKGASALGTRCERGDMRCYIRNKRFCSEFCVAGEGRQLGANENGTEIILDNVECRK